MKALLLLFIPMLCLYSQEPVLIACYPLDGHPHDTTWHGYSGVMFGCVSGPDRFGNNGAAMYFDGIDDYISIPDDIYTAEVDSLSFTLWFQDQGDNIGQHHLLYFGSRTGEIAVGKEGSLYSWGPKLNNQEWYAVRANVCNPKWHFITAIYIKGQYIKAYLDGILVEQLAIPDIILNNSHPQISHCSIGSYNRAERSFWHGFIDDIRIYKGELSQRNIDSLFMLGSDYDNYCEKFHFSIPDITADINSPVTIPVWARTEFEERNLQTRIWISYDIFSLQYKSMDNVHNGRATAILEGLFHYGLSVGQIGHLTFTPLVGDTISDIIIDSVFIDYKERHKIYTEDGAIYVTGYCMPGLRQIQRYEPTPIQLSTINNTININSDTEISIMSVQLYDLLGKCIINNYLTIDNKHCYLNTDTLTGLYYIRVTYNHDDRQKIFTAPVMLGL